MLLQSCIPALVLAHGAVASSHKFAQPPDPYRHVLRSGREYSTPQRRFPAVSRQVNNDVAMMTGRENNNNTMIMGQEISKDTIIPTIQEADSDAANSAAEPSPRRRQFSTYLFMESPEGCPSLQLECKDCGGHKLLGHRDEVAPSVRCSGLVDEDMEWKDCHCRADKDYELFVALIHPCTPLADSDAESDPDL